LVSDVDMMVELEREREPLSSSFMLHRIPNEQLSHGWMTRPVCKGLVRTFQRRGNKRGLDTAYSQEHVSGERVIRQTRQVRVREQRYA
jgi:hypothetical protein